MSKLNFIVRHTHWAEIEIDIETFLKYYQTEWEDYKKDNDAHEELQKDFIIESLYDVGLAEYLYPSSVDDGVKILDRDEEYELE